MEDKTKDDKSKKDVGSASKEIKDSASRIKGKSKADQDKASEATKSVPKKSSTGGSSGSSNNNQSDKKDGIDKVLSEMKKMSDSQDKAREMFEERLNEQAAHIQFLSDEWGLKTAGSSKENVQPLKAQSSKDKVPAGNWSDDSDDEKLEEICGSVADEEDEDEEEKEEDFNELLFGKDPKGIIPSKEEIAVFKKRTKLAEEFDTDEWREVKSKRVAKYFVGRPEARDFAGPQVDPDAPDLMYKNRKQGEKDMSELHKQLGAINFAQIRLAEDVKILVANAGITMAEFANPDIEMNDPREEASQSLEGVKEAATEMMKTIGSIGKMSTYAYLKLMIMRRAQFVESVDSSRVAQSMVKRLKPNTKFLFGDSLKQVCRTLKDGSQLTTQLQRGRAAKRGGFTSGFDGGFNGFRGRGGYRGRGRGGFRGRNSYRGFRRHGGRGKKE